MDSFPSHPQDTGEFDVSQPLGWPDLALALALVASIVGLIYATWFAAF